MGTPALPAAPFLRRQLRLPIRTRPGVCYVFDGPADPAALDGLRPEEEYADCWRGVLLCVADPPEHTPDGDHGFDAGDFYLFGDVRLLERVGPAAEHVRFGPFRGTAP